MATGATDTPQIKTFGLSEEDLNEIVEYFEVYRMFHLPSGVHECDLPVKVEEFGNLLEDMGFSLTESELWDEIKKADPERKGYVLISNFLEYSAKNLLDRSRITLDNCMEVFALMDRNRDNLINREDLRVILKLFGDSPPASYIKDMMKEVDLDGDEQISYDEFLFFTTGLTE